MTYAFNFTLAAKEMLLPHARSATQRLWIAVRGGVCVIMIGSEQSFLLQRVAERTCGAPLNASSTICKGS